MTGLDHALPPATAERARVLRPIALSPTIGRLAVLAAGAAFAAASMLPFWVTTVRHLTGYGSARVVNGANAWDGYFEPFLAVAGGALVLGALIAVVFLAARRERRPAVETAAYFGLGGVALGAMIAALAIGPGGEEQFPSVTLTTAPGVLALAGVVLAAVPLVVSLLPVRRPIASPATDSVADPASTGSRGTSIPSPVRAAGLLAVAILVTAGLVLGLLPVAPVAPGTAAPDGPIPDWRTTPNEPYPFSGVVPPLAATEIDGVYSREPTEFLPDRAHCVRCPPYPLDKGRSVMTLADGRFSIVHQDPHYRSDGHYLLSGTRIILINDPNCPEDRGVYRWSKDEAGNLSLALLADPCAFNQRNRDLLDKPWYLKRSLQTGERGYCDPPNEEGGWTNHYQRPEDCEPAT